MSERCLASRSSFIALPMAASLRLRIAAATAARRCTRAAEKVIVCAVRTTACSSTRGPLHRNPRTGKIPQRAYVRSYPVVARDELLWIWMGDPAKADTDKIIRFGWHTDPAWRKKRSYLHYQAPYTLIVDNLLDFSHLSYVHSTTIGTPSTATTRAQVEPIEGGLKITRRYYNDRSRPTGAASPPSTARLTVGKSTNGSRRRLSACRPARRRQALAHTRESSSPRRCSIGTALSKRPKRRRPRTIGSRMRRISKRRPRR